MFRCTHTHNKYTNKHITPHTIKHSQLTKIPTTNRFYSNFTYSLPKLLQIVSSLIYKPNLFQTNGSHFIKLCYHLKASIYSRSQISKKQNTVKPYGLRRRQRQKDNLYRPICQHFT